MKKILNLFLLMILVVIGLSFITNVSAATGDVYNIVTCPGEDMSTQIRINWQSKTSITNLKVEYTLASDTDYANAKSVNAEYHSFSRKDGDPNSSAKYEGFSTPRHIWNAEINNLNPSTKYIYRITDGSNVYASDYGFETAAGGNSEFSFLFLTDPQYYNELGASKFNVLTETHIQNDDIKFALITGDISDKGGSSSYWDMFYTKSSLKKVPFATTVGNHEYYDSGTVTTDNVIYNQYFNNPQNGPEHVKGSSYYFVYNNALFIMLDSEEKSYKPEQIEWFKNVCNSVSCSYIIVGTHKSSYAGAEYYSDGKNFIATWGKVFDECQVDLVLSGHDHMYARTKSIYKDEVTNEKYKGTTYILGGSAGIKYYGSLKSDENVPKWDKYFMNTTCGTVITLSEKNIKINAYAIGSYTTSGGVTTYTPGELKDSCTLVCKRFGTIDPTFTKESFEKTFTVENAMPDLTSGKISWGKLGYGYVNNISATNENSGVSLGSVSFINDSCTELEVDELFWIGEVNKIKVQINYKDGTTSTVNLELDNNIEWGTIVSVKPFNITATKFDLEINYELIEGIDYLYRFRVLQGQNVKKNYSLKAADKAGNKVIVEMNNGILTPDTTHTFTVQALNVNGTVIWSQEITVKSLREVSEEEQFQIDMANIAFKAMLDNLLAALGAETE